MQRSFLGFAAASGFFAVALGAFAAHGLKHRLSAEALAIFQTGVQYQMYHALALLAVGLMFNTRAATNILNLSGLAFILGSLLFCGSLYALALGASPMVGAITPLGGLSFLLGWLSLGLALKRV